MIHFTTSDRYNITAFRSFMTNVGSLGAGLLVISIIFLVAGVNPIFAISEIFMGSFGSIYGIKETITKAIPLILIGAGLTLAFRAKFWNIGAEGQFAFGAMGATWAALSFPEWPAWLLMPSMIIMAVIAGGAWGMIPALLRQKLKTNEIIVTLMMNYIAILFLDYLVFGVWKDPTSFGFPMTQEFTDSAIVGKIGSTSVNWGLLHCLVLGILIWVFFRFTRVGFELKASGDSVRAAKYAGLPYDRLVVLVMVMSGALAGWAGFIEASATINRLQPSIMVGYGYTAIVVAWLARLNPLSIGIAAFLLAGLRVGVENMQLDLQVPAAFGGIIEGLILLSVLAGGLFTIYKFERVRK